MRLCLNQNCLMAERSLSVTKRTIVTRVTTGTKVTEVTKVTMVTSDSSDLPGGHYMSLCLNRNCCDHSDISDFLRGHYGYY